MLQINKMRANFDFEITNSKLIAIKRKQTILLILWGNWIFVLTFDLDDCFINLNVCDQCTLSHFFILRKIDQKIKVLIT